MKRITFCADDYGMYPAVSDAILALAENDRIHGTACMVTAAHWASSVDALRFFDKACQKERRNFDVGLHLNMTEGIGLTPFFRDGYPKIGKLLLRTHLHGLSVDAVKDEVRAQLDRFCEQYGRMPDYIDGHQYVHHLPIIRDVVEEIMIASGIGWVRSVYPLMGCRGLKSEVIVRSGAKFFRRQIMQAGIKTNSAFSGIYSFNPQNSYRLLVQGWLQVLPDGGLVVCHPSYPSGKGKVDHGCARAHEFDYLSSHAFAEDCRVCSIKLTAQGSIQ
ncbi:Chitooligosaccharide deacetylase ChbG [invertebrate metagenome]|uniref:Chitooligosaccharide deacetylase ChbG n=1 Tax=invertebrate metagenome TaxID=1711999 RepID=A0A2H9T8D5_9ZZZZ